MNQVLEKVGSFEELQFLLELEGELKPHQELKFEVSRPSVPKNPRELDLALVTKIYEELAKDTSDTMVEEPVAGPSNATDETEGPDEHFQELLDILYENENYKNVKDEIESSIILRNMVIMHIDIIK